MRARRGLAVPLLVLGAVLSLTAPAAGAWVVASTAAAAAAAATTLDPPVSPSWTVTASSVTLTWSAPATGAIPTGYSVRRTAPSPTVVCVAVTVTTCTDTGLLPATSYSYAITSLAGAWVSAPLSATATTAATSPSAFLVTGPTTASAGTPFSVTIQARRSDGTNDTAYTGAHTLSFSGPGTVGGHAPVYPAGATFDANGSATVTVTLFKAESVTLTVADPSDSARTGVSGVVVIAPGAGAALRWTTDAAGLVDACPTGTVVVGAGGRGSWYVGILDQYGNQGVQGTTAATVTITSTTGNGTPPGGSLTVNAGANPAVTSTAMTMKLKKKNGTATTWRASVPSLSAASCTLSP